MTLFTETIQRARALVQELETIQLLPQEEQDHLQLDIADKVATLDGLQSMMQVFDQASPEEKTAFGNLLRRATESNHLIALSLEDFQARAQLFRKPAAAAPISAKQPVVLTPKPAAPAPVGPKLPVLLSPKQPALAAPVSPKQPAAAPQLKPKPPAAPSAKQAEDARIRNEQEREFHAGLVNDQINIVEKAWQAIYGALTLNPQVDFEKILAFYRQYSKIDPSILPEARVKIGQYIDVAEGFLILAISEQEEIDKEAKAKFEAEYAKQNPLRSLITALETNDLNALQMSHLSGEEKDRLRAELSKILNRQVGPGLLRHPLNVWPGDVQQKKQALINILGALAVIVPPEHFAEGMKRRFEEAQSPAAAPALAPKKPAANQPQAPAPVALQNTPRPACEKLMLVAMQLNELIRSIATDEFEVNVSMVESLDVQSSLGSFAGRLAYHVYFIHKSEKRISKEDTQYGTKALFRQEGFAATNDDRRRAIVRVIAEVSLEGLKLALQADDHASAKVFLDILENLVVHPKDCPEEQHNLAYSLFGSFYRGYSAAQERNPSLIHPHNATFRSDFGRLAFTNEAGPMIDARFKLEAIAELEVALKAAWKI